MDIQTSMSVLATIWDALCTWLDVRALGPLPATRVVLGERVSAHQAGDPYSFIVQEVEHAGGLWRRFQRTRDYSVLNDPLLCYVLEGVGCLLGEALGLSSTAATHFGDWLAQAITGVWSGGHNNEYVVAACETIASGAIYGEREQRACGAEGPEFWEVYPDGVRAVVAFLRA